MNQTASFLDCSYSQFAVERREVGQLGGSFYSWEDAGMTGLEMDPGSEMRMCI
jgi:hypothetical protein